MNSRRAKVADEVQYDVAIVGGGLVGASLAVALAPLGARVALLEAAAPRTGNPPSFDDRTLALSHSSCAILRGLNVWPALEANATPLQEIHVTQRSGPGQVKLLAGELGLESFGHVVEAREFGAVMMHLLTRLENVEFLCPAQFRGLETRDSHCRVDYSMAGQAGSDEYSLTARLVVGADGAESAVRQAVGISAERHDYGQSAVICNVSPQQAHRGRAFECFTSTGPFAVLPHVNGRCGLVWCVARGDAAALLDLPEDEFLCQAQRHFGDALGAWQRVGKRSSYELHRVRAERDVSGRTVILGNAAHAIHPVGAQGFNLGLRDVAVLAELIACTRARDSSADLGRAGLLDEYSTWRAPDQSGTLAYSDGLARLYSNPSVLAAMARTTGLLAHALIPPLRRQLAIRAMGYRGRIPRLALGESLPGGRP